ncbi:hypothetical protein B0H14DRAFT_3479452 [Mycena olivaceomarginata]|nr:hypothetical protein B0H14DRAFT_3479452 [Mycena olivaceomarginata]
MSLYATAPSLAQADEILDMHVSILPFSPTSFASGRARTCYVTPYLHRQRLRFVLALGGLSECPPTPTSSGSTLRPSQTHVLFQQIEDYTKAHFWVAVLSLESVHRLGAIREAKRILGDLVQVVALAVI